MDKQVNKASHQEPQNQDQAIRVCLHGDGLDSVSIFNISKLNITQEDSFSE